ncbi:uncharacterized protein LOC128987137 isoform X2 [Macrosteles quadrilineatus]|nr:uncharacterized protein LOC128987137 isoform X2 [Macrosteles quadrilineatus]XP_054263835.1 uncharacterized protein LOC128987137 isoform X2 [Macrosteles quadrilineatus]
MDLEIAGHCVGPLTKDYLSKLPHHVLPCMNLQRSFPFEEDNDFTNDHFSKNVLWESSLPIPITKLTDLTFEALNGIDQTTALIRNKLRWQMKKEKILNAVKKDKKNLSDKLIRKAGTVEAGSSTVLPRGIVQLAGHLDKDPDPQFSGVYNWYYTGGSLATLANNEENYLFYPRESNICCSQFENGQNKELFTLPLELNNPIYQIASSEAGVVTRQKSCVNLFNICQSEDKLLLNKIHTVSNKRDSFVSVALQDKSNEKYCTLSSSGILKLWDVEYSNGYKMKMKVAPGEGVHVMDNWSSIQFVDNKTLLLADRCCIHLLDCRVDMNEKQLAWCPRKLGEQCEQLSYVTSSCLQDQVVYCTTSHQVLSLDLRIGFGQRWSHMMAAPPYLGFTHNTAQHTNQEILCIGSQVMSDCICIVNCWRGGNPQAEYRPISLPSPCRGLILARQQGVCLEPTLSQRFSQSMIGLTCLPSTNGLHVVRQSATGDVFLQELSQSKGDEPSRLTSDQLTAYSEWSKPALSLQRDTTTVSVTDVKNLTPLLEALTETYSEEPEHGVEVEAEVQSGGWRRSKQYLEDCVDLLAGRLLSVWEVDDEEEWLEQQEHTLQEQDPAERVSNWLNDYTLQDTAPLKPKVTSTPYVRRVSPPRSLDIPVQPQTQPPQVPSPPPSPVSPPRKRQRLLQVTPPSQQFTSSTKPPTTTAKKKFIPGF